MKSTSILTALLAAALTLASCQNAAVRDPAGAGAGGQPSASTTAETVLPAPEMPYAYEADGSVSSTCPDDWFVETPIGIVYWSGMTLHYYDPQTGVTDVLCGKEGCVHERMTTDCAFAKPIQWPVFPIVDGEELILVQRPHTGEEDAFAPFRLVRTDLRGMTVQALYETERPILQVYLVGDWLYFDDGDTLCRIPKKGGELERLTAPDGGAIKVSDHLAVGGRILYEGEDGIYACTPELTESLLVTEHIPEGTWYTDGERLAVVTLSEGIYQIDPVTGDAACIWEIPENTRIENRTPARGGFTFRLRTGKTGEGLSYEDFEASFADKSLFYFSLSDCQVTAYDTGELRFLTNYLFGDSLLAIEIVNEDGAVEAGDRVVLSLTDPGTVYRVPSAAEVTGKEGT